MFAPQLLSSSRNPKKAHELPAAAAVPLLDRFSEDEGGYATILVMSPHTETHTLVPHTNCLKLGVSTLPPR